jgi:radical SAM superfamily enzyme YgiQ (UPF0313 family)
LNPATPDAKKVLLINPNQMKPPVAPLALDYLAHALRQNHFGVDILDLCFSADAAQAIDGYLARNSPVAIGITLRNIDDSFMASQDFFVPGLKEITDHLKTRTSAPLILGGSGFSVMPEVILSYCDVDLGLWGEGEYSLPLLIAKIATNQEWRDVPGLVYRSDQGSHRNKPKYLKLSEFTPERDALDNRRYFVEGGMGAVEDKRGCAKGCIYCADPLGKGKQVRLRTPDSVADEIGRLLELGIDHFHFCDSEFNIPEAHAREVCLKLIERGLGNKVRWYAYLSPAPFSDELANLCQRAGCAGIDFGADSGNDSVLRKLGRDFTGDDLRRTADACHRQGIVFMYDLLLGGPGESKKSLRETIELMKRLSPSRVGATMGIRIFAQTKLATLVQRQGPLTENPNLHGTVEGNDNFFAPLFYLSSALGPDAQGYLSDLIAGDERFFFGATGDADQNYNYNENTILVNAIKAGYRGAFWDILRRLAEGLP